MFIAWTTLATREEADALASAVIQRGLAVCVQIEGPIISHYRWERKQERSEEFRLCFKCLPGNVVELENYVLSRHPYSVPEWIAMKADHVGEKYLSWAGANPTNLTL